MKINGIDVQNPLVNGLNIKSVNTNNLLTTGNYDVPNLGVIKLCKIIPSEGVSITSATNTIAYSFLIPANTFVSSGLIDLAYRFQKSAGTGSGWNTRLYINTSNSLTGATLIGNIFAAGTLQNYIQGFRYLRLFTNNIYFLNTGVTALTDLATTTTVESSAPFNLTVDNYIILAIQKSNGNAEICKGLFCRALGY
jgi:hypothetical protein